MVIGQNIIFKSLYIQTKNTVAKLKDSFLIVS